jgi:predicted Rossmann fold flavoprotein
MMQTNLTIVIGGGAAGIIAAISKARQNEPVIICEKTSQIGKKISITGNGRCNLLNDDLNESSYNTAAKDIVKSIFACFGKSEILNFFSEIGLNVYSQDGRIFPVTNQAASVLKVLELELKRLSIPIEYSFDCTQVTFSNNIFTVSSDSGKSIQCRRVILTGGGKTYPAFGSDGSTYTIARNFGHSIIEPVPSAVPLVVKDALCHILQGQRIQAKAKAVIDGQQYHESSGELLFTKYGLSGTCILDISEPISIALNRYHKKDLNVIIDMIPFLNRQQLKNELERRFKSGLSLENILVGILPNKFSLALKSLFEKHDIATAVNSLKSRRFLISSTLGWNEAEFTCGGVDVNEIKAGTLESKLQNNVYFAGEILDVEGKRGGYNLAWAWASGFVAGLTK